MYRLSLDSSPKCHSIATAKGEKEQEETAGERKNFRVAFFLYSEFFTTCVCHYINKTKQKTLKLKSPGGTGPIRSPSVSALYVTAQSSSFWKQRLYKKCLLQIKLPGEHQGALCTASDPVPSRRPRLALSTTSRTRFGQVWVQPEQEYNVLWPQCQILTCF